MADGFVQRRTSRSSTSSGTSHPFRADRWYEIWEPAAARAMAFGAKGWSLTRNEEDPLHFRQASVWDSHEDWERYWYSDEIAAAPRAGGQLLQQAPPPRLARPDRGRVIRPLLAIAARITAGAALLLVIATPKRAEAAPCAAPTITNTAGTLSSRARLRVLTILMKFSVYRSGGTARFDYSVNDTFVGTFDTAGACGAPSRIVITGNYGADLIDLTRVSRATGITGMNRPDVARWGRRRTTISPRDRWRGSVNGGYGNDMLLTRNGAADQADCGPDVDSVQTDQLGIDSLNNCEVRCRTHAEYEPARRSARRSTAGGATVRRSRAAT